MARSAAAASSIVCRLLLPRLLRRYVRQASGRADGRHRAASRPCEHLPLRCGGHCVQRRRRCHRCGQSSCGRVQITSETSDASASADAVEMVVPPWWWMVMLLSLPNTARSLQQLMASSSDLEMFITQIPAALSPTHQLQQQQQQQLLK